MDKAITLFENIIYKNAYDQNSWEELKTQANTK